MTSDQIEAGNQRPAMRMMSMDGTVEPFPDGSLALYTLAVDSSLASPTAKVLRTLEILQNRPGITADGLAERLEVSDRAVRRYVEILREAGAAARSSRRVSRYWCGGSPNTRRNWRLKWAGDSPATRARSATVSVSK